MFTPITYHDAREHISRLHDEADARRLLRRPGRTARRRRQHDVVVAVDPGAANG